MMDLFKPTKEDVEEAKKSKFVEFKTGDTPTFLVEELKQDETKDKEKLTIGCQILGGEHDGRKYNHYVYATNKKFLIELLSCYYTDEDIMGGKFSIEELVGRKFKGLVKLNDWKGKTYTNFNKLEVVSDVPADLDTDQTLNIGPSKEDEDVF